MNKVKFIGYCLVLIFLIQGCGAPSLVDTNVSMPENSWTYANSLKTTVEVKETNKAYRVFFKLRHTSAYRYANLYVIMHLKGEGMNKHIRYQFKLAKASGEWLGKGSGDIYTSTFPLLNKFNFPKPGKYQFEIEQNMRDNPLVGMSDIGLLVESIEP
jgi:gliding motility-associated lipoprotein GldH